jgi:predicted nucleotidyltransferase
LPTNHDSPTEPLAASVRARLPGSTPSEAAETIVDFSLAAIASFGAGLRSIVLFGSAAEGRLRATSDVNLMVVLAEFSGERATRLSDAARLAFAASRLRAMYLLETELAGAAEAFAVKFDDIQSRHTILHGTDVFERLAIPREAILRRLDEVLLDAALKLRASRTLLAGTGPALARELADAASPLRAAARAMLSLGAGPSVSPKVALEQVCATLGRDWTDCLAQLSRLRAGESLLPEAVDRLAVDLGELAVALRAAVPRAVTAPEGGP